MGEVPIGTIFTWRIYENVYSVLLLVVSDIVNNYEEIVCILLMSLFVIVGIKDICSRKKITLQFELLHQIVARQNNRNPSCI